MDSGNDTAKPLPPLPGYNTNIRHRGHLFHIQTEDSGVQRPHVITHLFAEGGRVVASRKTSYAEHVGTDAYPAIVKELMKSQHKAIFMELRDGLYDDPDEDGDEPTKPRRASDGAILTAEELADTKDNELPDLRVFDRAAAQVSVRAHGDAERRSSLLPPEPRAARVGNSSSSPRFPETANSTVEKSLDEVILGYLSVDSDNAKGG